MFPDNSRHIWEFKYSSRFVSHIIKQYCYCPIPCSLYFGSLSKIPSSRWAASKSAEVSTKLLTISRRNEIRKHNGKRHWKDREQRKLISLPKYCLSFDDFLKEFVDPEGVIIFVWIMVMCRFFFYRYALSSYQGKHSSQFYNTLWQQIL